MDWLNTLIAALAAISGSVAMGLFMLRQAKVTSETTLQIARMEEVDRRKHDLAGETKGLYADLLRECKLHLVTTEERREKYRSPEFKNVEARADAFAGPKVYKAFRRFRDARRAFLDAVDGGAPQPVMMDLREKMEGALIDVEQAVREEVREYFPERTLPESPKQIP